MINFVGAVPRNKLVHGKRFVDSWIKETFIYLLVSLFMDFELLALEVGAGNLGPSAIAWSSYCVAMVSTSSYEMDRGKLRPNFLCESP